MAPIKRKGNGPDESGSRQPQKRVKVIAGVQRKDVNGGKNSKKPAEKSKDSLDSPSKTPAVSVLREEEPAFPRGGANILSPLEQKQIHIQATRDVLFEQKGAQAQDDIDNEDGTQKKRSSKEFGIKSTKGKTKSKKHTIPQASTKEEVRIEGLNFKRIVVGSKILGQVSSINAHDIGLSLPNNLTGYIPLTAVSKTLQQKIEKLLNSSQEEDDNSDGDDGGDGDLDLKSYFKLGQYLRAAVTSTETEVNHGKVKGKKHIELSVDPREANSGLSKSDLVVNATVQASVLSVEDHGLVMDLGLEDGQTRGFMSSKEIPHDLELLQIKEGTVFLCVVTGHNANGSVVKLSANLPTAGSIKKSHFLASAPTINSFLPGTAAEILLTQVTSTGMAGKIMGMLDAVVDIVQSGATAGKEDITARYHVGAKIKGRLICTFPTAEPLKLGFSILDHVVKFTPTVLDHKSSCEGVPAISAIVPEVKVTKVEPGLGVYVQFNDKHYGFVHISRLSDDKVDSISSTQGPYMVDSTHEARIVGFSALDNLYLLSLERKVIDQPFLRLEDVTVGAVVKGKIEKLLIGPDGISGLIVSLADGISGLVPGMHMSDTKLQHPEKKFREGVQVSARILSVNLEKRQLRLTLKKTLLNSESSTWCDYSDILPGNQSPGTIISIQSHGAIVQFYGEVRGFLPVSEMSEAYIKDPAQHFNIGQVVNVHALNVDAELRKLVVSCKDQLSSTEAYKRALEHIHPGNTVSGTVFEKSNEDILLKLEDSGLVARLNAEHVSDGQASRNGAALARIRVGQKLNELLILNMQKSHRLIKVTNKPSLKQARQRGELPAKFEDLEEGSKVTGFVKNIIADGLFVEFLGGLTGFVPKRLVDDDHVNKPSFGYALAQPISLTVQSIEDDRQRFILTLKEPHTGKQRVSDRDKESDNANQSSINPIDGDIKSLDDLTFGRITKAKVVSIKETQINVQLAENIQGRIDVSEVFDSWEAIKDRKQPLRFFKAKQILPVRIIGIHDARSHRFLPISHRSGKYPVFELSAKPSSLESTDLDLLSLDKVKIGSAWIGFVNNIGDDCLWISISPNVRGRLRLTDVSDDLSLLSDITTNFPVGSAIKVHVTGVDTDKNRLDLSAKHGGSPNKLTISDFSKGEILLGRVTRVTEHQVLVQLSDTVVGAINLIDMADDYSKINPADFHKNELLRVCVVDIDVPKKKILLSMRSSRVLSSSLPIQDPEISSISQIKVNDIVRGFVRRVADNGLFVTLGHDVTAYVRISDLSDSYLKEWQNEFQVNQLVRGRVILADPESNKLQMSLKQSVLDPNYKTPITIKDLKRGQTVTGKVRNVEEFGAFIVIDGTANLSGLCHRTEMAEGKVEDARKLFEKGDIVKAKIVKIDLNKERISLGLKASYFKDSDDESDGENVQDKSEENVSESQYDGGMDLELESGDDISMGGVDLEDTMNGDNSESDSSDWDVQMTGTKDAGITGGLVTSGFDWNGNNTVGTDEDNESDSDSDNKTAVKKKKRRKQEIQVDRTGDLDTNGPQSVADYERLLLGEPNSSLLWLKYMAFQLELSEVDKAREIAERALRSISIGQDTEKFNIWVAMLNLENTFGNDDTLEDVFKRACQYNDPQEIHERLTSIYIQSGKHDKADELFQAILKKKFTQSPNIYLNFATFLFDTRAEPERGRALLPRAIQSLPTHTHVDITSKFGQLEFRSPNGDIERGRTIFEGLISSFPKRVDLWNVLLDLEIKNGDMEQVRRLFERVLGLGHPIAADGTKPGAKRLKDKQAKFFFKKWLAFEEKTGDEKMVDEVKARAADYVRAIKAGQ
ncbi:ribosomal RNA processing protein RRP5 [Histoplasma capsulatum var. duboisii H88]|uniref:rRNA biogenesis protein RRP5 n=2 Tax=Ajellomyces capsulatus (strain H88) TaxID=544711 RepID=F0U8G3_AJEC8|nr:ribosomal RNA processing protein RRP5 [Histoplasma capsulatum var. duboisii H88]